MNNHIQPGEKTPKNFREALNITYSILIATGISLIRKPFQFSIPGLAQEEGWYLAHAVQKGLASLFEPNAGYLDLAGRTGALFSQWLSLLYFPQIWMSFYLALTGFYIYSICSSRITPIISSIALATAFLLFPSEPEWQATPLYTFWIAQLILLQIEIQETAGKDVKCCRYIYPKIFAKIFLILSGPFSALLIPLYFLRSIARKGFGKASAMLCLAASCLSTFYTASNGRAHSLAVEAAEDVSASILNTIKGLLWRISSIFTPANVPKEIKIWIGAAMVIFIAITLLPCLSKQWRDPCLKKAAILAAWLAFGSCVLGFLAFKPFMTIENTSAPRYLLIPLITGWQCFFICLHGTIKAPIGNKLIPGTAIIALVLGFTLGSHHYIQQDCINCQSWQSFMQNRTPKGMQAKYDLRYTPGWQLSYFRKPGDIKPQGSFYAFQIDQ